jgi:hypothetical protein
MDWFLVQFEGRAENSALIRQVILKYCSCLIALGVLHQETNKNKNVFQV